MRIKKHLPFLILVLSFVNLSVFTQNIVIPTKAEIDSRKTQVNPTDKNIPVQIDLLRDEKDELTAEINRYKAVLRTLNKDISQDIDSLQETTKDFLENVDSLDCSDENTVNDKTTKTLQKLDKITKLLNRLAPNSVNLNSRTIGTPLERIARQFYETNIGKNCTKLKDTRTYGQLTTYIKEETKKLNEQHEKNQELKPKIENLIKALQERLNKITEKLNTKNPQLVLSNWLWAIIAVIGIFSIFSILIVKVFDRNIQIEWIASGQLIQFITVTILLSTLMALGLAGIIKENTLGTLLGGIAGYVLSQGVGRAVARAASRVQKRTQTEKNSPIKESPSSKQTKEMNNPEEKKIEK